MTSATKELKKVRKLEQVIDLPGHAGALLGKEPQWHRHGRVSRQQEELGHVSRLSRRKSAPTNATTPRSVSAPPPGWSA